MNPMRYGGVCGIVLGTIVATSDFVVAQELCVIDGAQEEFGSDCITCTGQGG